MLAGLLGALAIGLSLGLLGSGGSILTVPVLVYLFGQEEKVAIAGSLAVVGSIALAGAIPYAARRLIDWRNVLWFGLPGMAGTYLGAWIANFLSGAAQLALFAAVMLLAAIMMLRPSPVVDKDDPERHPVKIVADGLGVGALTGIVGVGGGFLIVPALVLLGGLGMQLAVGTSLVIIAMKSASGFVKYLDVLDRLDLSLDWKVLGLVTACGIVGTFAGNALSGRIPQSTLRRIFAIFLLVMGGWILWQTVPKVI
ncbi:MAG: sulfite exporter TauE/SafE family protein [Gammaproteobacteria bacterium]|jgi:hypothetical protein